MSARVIQVIETTTHRGNGTTDEPYRIVTQYFAFDGELLAESDPHLDTILREWVRLKRHAERADDSTRGAAPRGGGESE